VQTDGALPPARETREPRFVGRARELAEIELALSGVEGGRGRLLLLAGEPGIGKTSLADAATKLAEMRGLTVHWGRCWESGGAPAYWPWLGVLSAMAQVLDDEALATALGDGAPVLAEILPELRQRLPRVAAGAAPPPEEARFRVFRAVVALAQEASHREPRGLAVVLDDLHAADRSSLLLLHFLARELRRLKLLVIGTYRDVEARMEAETSELISRIVREGTSLSVPRLAAEDATHLVNAHAGALAERTSARIVERAQGNPLFLEEMLRLLDEQGAESIDAGVVPHGVRDVIGQRLARVSAETRALIELAAVAGDEIEPALLAHSSAQDASTVAGALGEAMRAGVLTQRGERRRFGHALFREVLYRELSPERRRELHGRVAQALVQAGFGDAPPHAKLAHHALEGPPELHASGVEHAILAAQRAGELLAYDDAVETLERARVALSLGSASPLLQARLLVALAEASIRRGDGAAGKAHCREAVALARGAGNAELAARAALTYGRVFAFGSVDPVLVGMLESSLEALPPGDSALRAQLLGRLAAALQPSTQIEEPVRLARAAIATARRLGDERTLLDVLHDSISALMDCAAPAEVRSLNLEAEALARELGDRECLLRTQGRLFFSHLAYGEFDLADARIDAYEALARELAAPWIGYRSLCFRALRATIHGRFAEAERLLGEALKQGEAAGDPLASSLHVRGLEALHRASERHDALLGPDSLARRERTEYRFASLWQSFHAGLAHARREEPERAVFNYQLLPSAFPANLFSYFFMLEIVAIGGKKEQAEDLLQRVSACPDEYLALGWTYVSWEGPRSRFLALLLGRLERYDEAGVAFEDALEKLSQLEAWPYHARTQYEYARLLLERGTPQDLERARSLLGSARERALSLGMPGLITHIERRMSQLSGTLSSPPAATVPVTLTGNPAGPPLVLVREGEYFTVTHRDQIFRLKDSLGLRYIARLLETPGQELHVLDLVHERAAAGTDAAVDRGDAGELLDATARERYERRLADLEEALAEAEAFGDLGRAERAREELDFLARELGRAVGLGGQARRAGAAAERARSAVQRRIRHAIERLGAHSPPLADFLNRSVRTGNYCTFIPVPD
jgi:tetratricopeptide (TPR) repeat protein